MRKTTLILAFLAVVACGGAQEFLTPQSYGIYSSNRYGNETLFRLLFQKTKSNNAVWEMEYETFFLCAPSFSAEYALVIGNGELVLTRANQNIYMALSRHLQDRKPDPLKVVSVDIKKMSVSEEVCKRLSELFNLATMKATHIESKHSGLDGTTYYFNHRRKLASVWQPEGGRTARLVLMAVRLCDAVRLQDTAILNQQMKECGTLIQEFKEEWPARFFKPIQGVTRHSDGLYCEFYCTDCIRLKVPYGNTSNNDTCDVVAAIYSDSLSAWSRELFLMYDLPEFPTVVIDNTRDTAFCEARIYYGHVVRTITLSSRFWRREVILPSVQLPPGQYYFAEGEWRKQ
jgi:hypothetical protein